jgi:peptide/nickel transport system permease protein
VTGDPVALHLPANASPEARAELSHRLGYDQPIPVQLWRYAEELAHFDLGESLRQSRPAIDIVLAAFPVTLRLASLTIVIALGLSLLIGSLAAWRPGSVFDRLASFVSLMGASVPDFWAAIVLILVFSIGLQLLPTSGMGTPLHWIMPVAVLMMRPFGIITQVVRSSMITALSSDYVKTARSKGVGPRSIIFVHALRNAMLPVVTVAGDQAANLINGAVIAETVFGFPGIGKIMLDAIQYRDFSVLQAAVLVAAVTIFALNMVIDAIYLMLDPRIGKS